MNITKFTIYGERHSGTNFLHKFIKLNFDLDHTIKLGNKHFFQLENIIGQNTSDTIVFCITRNPYDWLTAMYKLPHHCAFHYKNMNGFLSTEWWSRDEFLGPEILEDRNWTNNKRYKNILELRYYKLCFFYLLPRLIKNYIHINYEDFLWTPQEKIVDSISRKFKIVPSRFTCVEIHKFKNRHSLIDQEAFNTINNTIDWDLEYNFGYKPFDSYEHYVSKYSSVDPGTRLWYDNTEVTNENSKSTIFQNEYFAY